MTRQNRKINLFFSLLAIADFMPLRTCHWCHVMERESFEDQEVADRLNEGFVAIKVDREERPDIDHFYMEVCQALNGSGGWPLTVFLTPAKKPFYAGTYFPKKSKYGRPGLLDVLTQLRDLWQNDRSRLENAGEKIVGALQPKPESHLARDPEPEILEQGYRSLKMAFDPLYGGFGQAPKFPSPHQFFFLLRYWKQRPEPMALEMVEKTLKAMYVGGIYDHIGFGFARYSTDRKWLVPHFEKMLYDNALLALAYLETYQATHNPFYAKVAREIFTYVLRDMVSPSGGFYTAEDADSEGEEGKFYVWTRQEILDILGKEEGEFFADLYDITPSGNFEGQNIPNLIKQLRHNPAAEFFSGAADPGTVADPENPNLTTEPAKTNLPNDLANPNQVTDPANPTKSAEPASLNPVTQPGNQNLAARLENARQKLFAVREQRVHPFKDDKVLTAWNGLMIAALARGAWVLNEKRYAQAASQAVNFILKKLRNPQGRLLARYRDGEANYLAYLDDYAYLTWGLIELYQATFIPNYLEMALQLTKELQELFGDREKGGFFFIGHDAEQMPSRTKQLHDGAIPSGNSVAALNLLRLARLIGNTELEKAANSQLRTFTEAVTEYPAGYTYFLCALSFALEPPLDIVIAGSESASVERINADDPTSPVFKSTREELSPEQPPKESLKTLPDKNELASSKPDGPDVPDAQSEALFEVLRATYLPQATLLFHNTGEAGTKIAALAPSVADKNPLKQQTTVYLCQNYACQPPITDPAELSQQIRTGESY